ncbi:MAG: nitronate monooxygenase family protein [Dehalococcoidales bacterium]|nr:nitronate monooxygenase family protein [Dehalococcoidales bacterium]
MFKTRVTELFGIKYPIIQGALGGGLATAELVAAVSNAGGLGMITSLNYGSAQELRDAIRKTRKLTDKPFAVNVTLLPTMRRIPYEEYFTAALEEGMRIFETSGRSPEPYIKMVKDAGGKFMHKVGSARHAKSAERIGVDAVNIVCFESAGHPLPDDVAASVLIPSCVDAVKIPVIQAGGVADGRGFIAALALGAEGVLMGTRFTASKECAFHPKLKEWFTQLTEKDTMLVHRTINNLERVVRTDFTQKILEMEEKGAPVEEILPLISGDKVRAAYETGETSNAIITAGQTVGLIHDIPNVKEIIDRIILEAENIIKRLNRIERG